MKKNFLYFFISSILSAGLGFVIAIYLGHVLEPQEYGYLGIFAMVLYLVEPMIAFFSFGLLEINKITLSSANYEIFKKKTINLGIVNTIVTMFIVFFISFFYPNYRTLLLFIPFLALSRLFLRIKWIELIQEKKAKEYALLFSLVSIAMAVLTLVLISGLGMNWEGRILAMVLAEYSIAWFLYKNYNFEIVFFKKQEFTEVFKFGLPLFVALGAAWLLQESDKFIVLKYFDLSAVGIYTFAYMIGRAMQIFNQAFLKMLRPYYYKLLHKGQMTIRFHLKYVFLYALLILLCATLLSVLLNYFREAFCQGLIGF
jgi:O-antigen/teichoic acid export membrane protein